MTARYPSGAITFNYRHDSTDLIQAADVNVLYDEVIAVGSTLGLDPHKSTIWGTTTTLDTSKTDWSSYNGISGRLQNIENGLYTAYTNRVNTFGGSTITPASTSTKGLVVKAVSSQTANLFEAQASGSTTAVTKIDKDGILSLNGSQVATLSTSETLSNKTLASSTISGTSNTISDVPAAAVIATGTTDIKTYVDAKPTGFYQSTAPTGTIPTGSIWMDSSSSITSFDPTAFLAISAASVSPSTTGFRRVTTSTSAPTSGDGANGDVWLQYI
jgi:hypothetical protein